MISFNTYKGLCLDTVIILIVTGEKKEGQSEGLNQSAYLHLIPANLPVMD